MLFNLVRKAHHLRGIRLTPLCYLEDLDYADDLALLSQKKLDIQEKTQCLNTLAREVGLNISSKKTETMALNVINARPIQIDSEELETDLPMSAVSSLRWKN